MLSDPLLNRAHCRAEVPLCVKERPVMAFILPKIAHFLGFPPSICHSPTANTINSSTFTSMPCANVSKCFHDAEGRLELTAPCTGATRHLWGNRLCTALPSPHISASIDHISCAQSRLAPSFKDPGKILNSISTLPGTEGWSCCSRHTW